jgi:leader peptidase (prepilin peptidase) / N-methyltransferase
MSDIFLLFILTLLGLIFGSFISALSYRLVNGISIFKGRSFCDQCKKQIRWFDNIPIFSFYFLKGKSACCKELISLRYPLIEFATTVIFFITGFVLIHSGNSENPVYIWHKLLGFSALPNLLFISVFLITIFVTDFEKKLILDSCIFIPLAITLLLIIFFNPDYTYANLFLAFASASFFLLIHLLTKGRGMGLGDVKLVLIPPLILGWPYTIIWLFLSFIIGAVVGVILILLGKAKFGKQIPFGPFLIISYFIVLFWGEKLLFLFNF